MTSIELLTSLDGSVYGQCSHWYIIDKTIYIMGERGMAARYDIYAGAIDTLNIGDLDLYGFMGYSEPLECEDIQITQNEKDYEDVAPTLLGQEQVYSPEAGHAMAWVISSLRDQMETTKQPFSNLRRKLEVILESPPFKWNLSVFGAGTYSFISDNKPKVLKDEFGPCYYVLVHTSNNMFDLYSLSWPRATAATHE